jgi:Transposase IS116/IS110/IS902 family
MDVYLLDHTGETVGHRHMQAHPDALLQTIAPDRDHMVMAVEGVFTGYWLAALCAGEGLPCVRGHALDRQALHGGKATDDPIAAQQSAVVRRGGRRPQASVDPAAMRATRALERSIRNTVQPHHAQPLSLLRTGPGIGALLSLGLLSENPALARCPRGHDCLSYGRLVKCTKESAGKRDGTSGTQLGHASRPWAFSEAAGLLHRDIPVGQQDLTTLEHTHGSGQALPRLAQTLGRAVYDRLKRHTAFAMGQLLTGAGRGVAEPHASLDNHGRSRHGVRCTAWSWRRCTHRSPEALLP